jgi:hypothetical protein
MPRGRPPDIAGIAIAALALAGCGEDPGIQQGTVPFQSTSTGPFHSLSDQMKKTTRGGLHTKKSEGGGKPAAVPQGVSESQPGAGSKPAGESKPAAESRPAESRPGAESQPATEGG